MRFRDTVRECIRRGATGMIRPTRTRGRVIYGSTGEDWQKLAVDPHANSTTAIGLQAIMDKIGQSGPVAGIYDSKANFKPDDVTTRALENLLTPVFGKSFYEIIAFSQKVYGPAYGIVDRAPGGRMLSIFPFMAPQVRPDVKDGVQIYMVTPHGGGNPFEVASTDIIDMSSGLPDPRNSSLRVSALQMSLRAVCTDNECDSFNAAIMRAPFPGIVVAPKEGEVTGAGAHKGKRGKEKLEESLNDLTGDRRGDKWILPVPADVKTLGYSPDQMATVAISKLSMQKICAALGLDPMAVGLPSETKTYANYAEARRAMIEDTILPTWDHILRPLNSYLMATKWLPNPGMVLLVDRTKYVELDSDRFDKEKNARENFKVGATSRDELRAALGLKTLKDDRTYFDMDINGVGSADTNTKKGLSRAERIAAERLHDLTGDE